MGRRPGVQIALATTHAGSGQGEEQSGAKRARRTQQPPRRGWATASGAASAPDRRLTTGHLATTIVCEAMRPPTARR